MSVAKDRSRSSKKVSNSCVNMSCGSVTGLNDSLEAGTTSAAGGASFSDPDGLEKSRIDDASKLNESFDASSRGSLSTSYGTIDDTGEPDELESDVGFFGSSNEGMESM